MVLARHYRHTSEFHVELCAFDLQMERSGTGFMLAGEQSVPSRMNRIIETTTDSWNNWDMMKSFCAFEA